MDSFFVSWITHAHSVAMSLIDIVKTVANLNFKQYKEYIEECLSVDGEIKKPV